MKKRRCRFVLNILSEDFNKEKSYIRNIRPDFQLEVFPDPNNDDLWHRYYLNFGDLFICAVNASEAPDAFYKSIKKSYDDYERFNEMFLRCYKEIGTVESVNSIDEATAYYRKSNSALSDFVFKRSIDDLFFIDNNPERLLVNDLRALLLVNGEEYGAVTAKKLNENLKERDVFNELDIHIRYFKDTPDEFPFATEEYTFIDGYSLLTFDIRKFACSDKEIKICENCDRFFIPASRSDEKYCDFAYKDGKSCKEVAFEERVKNDDILKAYRKIYKTQNARKQRNSHIAQISERFTAWSASAQIALRQCQNGEISIENMVDKISASDWIKGGDSNAKT